MQKPRSLRVFSSLWKKAEIFTSIYSMETYTETFTGLLYSMGSHLAPEIGVYNIDWLGFIIGKQLVGGVGKHIRWLISPKNTRHNALITLDGGSFACHSPAGACLVQLYVLLRKVLNVYLPFHDQLWQWASINHFCHGHSVWLSCHK